MSDMEDDEPQVDEPVVVDEEEADVMEDAGAGPVLFSHIKTTGAACVAMLCEPRLQESAPAACGLLNERATAQQSNQARDHS